MRVTIHDGEEVVMTHEYASRPGTAPLVEQLMPGLEHNGRCVAALQSAISAIVSSLRILVAFDRGLVKELD